MAPRRTKAELDAEQAQANQDRVVTWATVHGAPIMILEGWNPDDGTWAPGSPIGNMLALIEGGNYLSVAAARVGLRSPAAMTAKGAEYLIGAPEDRAFIPIDVRPFTDLSAALERAEAQAEMTLVKTARDGARNDPKLAMMFLGRRFAQRWREQQAIFTADDVDERDKAITDALSDPNVAAKLAEIGHEIEDRANVNDDD